MKTIISVIALLGLAGACRQQSVDAAKGGGARMMWFDEERRVAKVVLNYYEQQVKPEAPTTNPSPPLESDSPGWWPFENKRVIWIRHARQSNLEYPKGRYTSLVRDKEDAKVKRGVKAAPEPDIEITSGWLYVSGDKPCVGTTAVVAQAEGCKVLLYYSPNDTGATHRVCYLEGDADKLVWVFPRQGDENARYLSVGTYIDAQTSGGEFQKWSTNTQTLDMIPEGPERERHNVVMQAVQEGRYRYQID